MALPKIQGFLAALDLETSDARNLFKLLDIGGTSMIDTNEFVSGCLRLKGSARSIDMARLMHDVRWCMSQLSELSAVHDDVAQLQKGLWSCQQLIVGASMLRTTVVQDLAPQIGCEPCVDA